MVSALKQPHAGTNAYTHTSTKASTHSDREETESHSEEGKLTGKWGLC